MSNLYKHHYANEIDLSIREKIKKINLLISNHEEKLANPILNFLSKEEKFNLYGKSSIKNKNRAPTISFTVKNRKSSEICELLIENNIATKNDNFYAWRCLKALGLDLNDGLIRISLLHYNTQEECEKLIKTLKKIN